MPLREYATLSVSVTKRRLSHNYGEEISFPIDAPYIYITTYPHLPVYHFYILIEVFEWGSDTAHANAGALLSSYREFSHARTGALSK